MTKTEELEHLRGVRLRLIAGESVEESQRSDSGNNRRIKLTPGNLHAVEARIRTLEFELQVGSRRRPFGVCL